MLVQGWIGVFLCLEVIWCGTWLVASLPGPQWSAPETSAGTFPQPQLTVLLAALGPFPWLLLPPAWVAVLPPLGTQPPRA